MRENVSRFFKSNIIFQVWGMTQMVELLPSKHKALSSNPSTVKKKNMIFLL
jgi:hypothetical protein